MLYFDTYVTRNLFLEKPFLLFKEKIQFISHEEAFTDLMCNTAFCGRFLAHLIKGFNFNILIFFRNKRYLSNEFIHVSSNDQTQTL